MEKESLWYRVLKVCYGEVGGGLGKGVVMTRFGGK